MEGYARWLRSTPRLVLADCTIERLQARVLGGRVRTVDLVLVAEEAVRLLPELGALEVLSPGGALAALAGARECPFGRVEQLRAAAPGLVFRATMSAATGLGRSATSRGGIVAMARQLAAAGVDVVRVVDPFNDPDRLAAAVDATGAAGLVVEGGVCIRGPLPPSRSATLVEGFVAVAATLERAGAHAVAVEDSLGVMRPVVAYSTVRAIRREVRLPVWVRVVDSRGFGLASAIAAVEAGAVGLDTVLGSLAGVGYEPDALALLAALEGTERQPEGTLGRIVELDRQVGALVALLGGSQPLAPPPPDGPDRGVDVATLASVLPRGADAATVSDDHALAACEAAWSALGGPGPVAPAAEAVALLARQLLSANEPAGRLLDRARADDPQGLLDSVASLREGGFPELPVPSSLPEDRAALVELLWKGDAPAYFESLAAFGSLELVPGAACLYGLGPGEALEAMVGGEVHEVRVVSAGLDGEEPSLELDGVPVRNPLSGPSAAAHSGTE